MSLNPFATVQEDVATTTDVADEVKTTTCYMCACRCGIRVYLKDGTVRQWRVITHIINDQVITLPAFGVILLFVIEPENSAA